MKIVFSVKTMSRINFCFIILFIFSLYVCSLTTSSEDDYILLLKNKTSDKQCSSINLMSWRSENVERNYKLNVEKLKKNNGLKLFLILYHRKDNNSNNNNNQTILILYNNIFDSVTELLITFDQYLTLKYAKFSYEIPVPVKENKWYQIEIFFYEYILKIRINCQTYEWKLNIKFDPEEYFVAYLFENLFGKNYFLGNVGELYMKSIISSEINSKCSLDPCTFISKNDFSDDFNNKNLDVDKYEYSDLISLILKNITTWFSIKVLRCEKQNIVTVSRYQHYDKDENVVKPFSLKPKLFSSDKGLIFSFNLFLSNEKSNEKVEETILRMYSFRKEKVLKILLIESTFLRLQLSKGRNFKEWSFDNERLINKKWNKIEIEISTLELILRLNCGEMSTIPIDEEIFWDNFKILDFMTDEESGEYFKGSISGLSLIPLSILTDLGNYLCTMDKCYSDDVNKMENGDIISNEMMNDLDVNYMTCEKKVVEILSKTDKTMKTSLESSKVNFNNDQYQNGFHLSFYIYPKTESDSKLFIFYSSTGKDLLKVGLNKYIYLIKKENSVENMFKFGEVKMEKKKWYKVDLYVNTTTIFLIINCDERNSQKNVGILNWKKFDLYQMICIKDEDCFHGLLAGVRIQNSQNDIKNCNILNCLEDQFLDSEVDFISPRKYESKYVPLSTTTKVSDNTWTESTETKTEVSTQSSLIKNELDFSIFQYFDLIPLLPENIIKLYNYKLFRCLQNNVIILSRRQSLQESLPSLKLRNNRFISNEGFIVSFYMNLSDPIPSGDKRESILRFYSNNEEVVLQIHLVSSISFQVELISGNKFKEWNFEEREIEQKRWNKIEIQISLSEISLRINCGEMSIIPIDEEILWDNFKNLDFMTDKESGEYFKGSISGLSLIPLSILTDLGNYLCTMDKCYSDGVNKMENGDIISNEMMNDLDVNYVTCEKKVVEILSKTDKTMKTSLESSKVNFNNDQYQNGFHLSFYIYPKTESDSKLFIFYSSTGKDSLKVGLNKYIYLIKKENSVENMFKFGEVKMEKKKWYKVDLYVNTTTIFLIINCDERNSQKNVGILNWKKFDLYQMICIKDEDCFHGLLAGVRIQSSQNDIKNCNILNCLEDQFLYSEVGSISPRNYESKYAPLSSTTKVSDKTWTESTETKTEVSTQSSLIKNELDFNIFQYFDLIPLLPENIIKLYNFKLFRCLQNNVIILSRRQSLQESLPSLKLRNNRFISNEGFIVSFYMNLSDPIPSGDKRESILRFYSNNEEVMLQIHLVSSISFQVELSSGNKFKEWNFEEREIEQKGWNKIEIQISLSEISLRINCGEMSIIPIDEEILWDNFKNLDFMTDKESGEYFKGSISGLSLIPLSILTDLGNYLCTMDKCYSDGVNKMENGDIISNEMMNDLDVNYVTCEKKVVEILSKTDKTMKTSLESSKVNFNNDQYQNGFHLSFYIYSETESDSKLFIFYSSNGKFSLKVGLNKYLYIIVKENSIENMFKFGEVKIEKKRWFKMDLYINTTTISLVVNCDKKRSMKNIGIYKWNQLDLFQMICIKDKDCFKGYIADTRIINEIIGGTTEICDISDCLEVYFQQALITKELEKSQTISSKQPITTTEVLKKYKSTEKISLSSINVPLMKATTQLSRKSTTFNTTLTSLNLSVQQFNIAFILKDDQLQQFDYEFIKCSKNNILVLSRYNQPSNSQIMPISFKNNIHSKGFLLEFYLNPQYLDVEVNQFQPILYLFSSNGSGRVIIQLIEECILKLEIFQIHDLEFQPLKPLKVKNNRWNKVGIQFSSTEIAIQVNCGKIQRLPNIGFFDWNSFENLHILFQDQSPNSYQTKISEINLIPLNDRIDLNKRQCSINDCFRSKDETIKPQFEVGLNLVTSEMLNHIEVRYKKCGDRFIEITRFKSNLESVNEASFSNIDLKQKEFDDGFKIEFYLKPPKNATGFILSLESKESQLKIYIRGFLIINIKDPQRDIEFPFLNLRLAKLKWNHIQIIINNEKITVVHNCKDNQDMDNYDFINWREVTKFFLFDNNEETNIFQGEISDPLINIYNPGHISCSILNCLLQKSIINLDQLSTKRMKIPVNIISSTIIPKEFTTIQSIPITTSAFPIILEKEILLQGKKGEKGMPGEKGFPGPMGIPGEKGNIGDKGAVGEKGYKGEMGLRGQTGAPGIRGLAVNGETGIQGSQGYPGNQGEKGNKGLKGRLGFQGSNGNLGLKGEKGIKGIKGDDGSLGIVGYQGLRGPQGKSGKTGNLGKPGVKGVNGRKGVKGEIGLTGPKGLKGSKGVIGIQGLKGIKGEIGKPGKLNVQTGLKGIPGVSGQRGDDGLPGSKGMKGSIGIKGENGEPGLSGIAGLPGEKGVDGVIGLPGPNGLPGEKGQPGEIGIIGTPGDDGEIGEKGDIGEKGIDGFIGQQGPKGIVGIDGAEGLPGKEGEKGIQPASLPGVKGNIGEMGVIGEIGLKGDKGIKGDEGSPGIMGPAGFKGIIGDQGLIINGVIGNVGINGNIGPKGIEGIRGPKGDRGYMGMRGDMGPLGRKGLKGDIGENGEEGILGSLGSNGNVFLRIYNKSFLSNLSSSLLDLYDEKNKVINLASISLHASSEVNNIFKTIKYYRMDRGLSSIWPLNSCQDLKNNSAQTTDVWLDPNQGHSSDSFQGICKRCDQKYSKITDKPFLTCIRSTFESGDLLTYLKPYDSETIWQSELRLEGLALFPPNIKKGYPHDSQLRFLQTRSVYAEQEIEFLCEECVIYGYFLNNKENFNYATLFQTFDDNYIDLLKGHSFGPGYGYLDKRIYFFDNGHTVFNVTILYDECKYKAPGTFTKMVISTNKPDMLPITDFGIKFFGNNGKCILGANIYPTCFV